MKANRTPSKNLCADETNVSELKIANLDFFRLVGLEEEGKRKRILRNQLLGVKKIGSCATNLDTLITCFMILIGMIIPTLFCSLLLSEVFQPGKPGWGLNFVNYR